MSTRMGAAVAAMYDNKGNLRRAARQLGISPQALYGLFKRAGVNPDSFRQRVNVNAPALTACEASTGVTDSASVNSQDAPHEPTFPPMAATAAARRPTHRNLPMDPEQYARLEEAKWDLAAKMRRDLTPAGVMALFFSEEFEGWLERRLADSKNTR